MNRLVCVANRVSLRRAPAASGGLAVGIVGALQHTGGVWFGWSGDLVDNATDELDIHVRGGVTYATMKLPREEFERSYDGFANGALWPLFHYMPSKFRFNPEELAAYHRINERFARRLISVLKPSDLIWIHDYHLIPLGARLRELGARQPIGFFLHTPFPHTEVLRVLPTYAELLRDLTAYDLLGFQTAADLGSFRAAAADAFGPLGPEAESKLQVGNRTLVANAFPIGVDVQAIHDQAVRARDRQCVRRMAKSLLGRKLMIGVDRLDYSKGLVERFAAYEQFLEAFPDNRGRITYLQIAPLSRTDLQSYIEIRRALEQAAGRTNGRFADTDWTPIRYINRNYPHRELMGFYRAAHVGIVTPLRDGMNLVAKEYLAAQDPEDPGVLVLSNLAGAARELDGAVIVNPYDIRHVGHAIQTALTMSLSERRARHASLLMTLRKNSITAWADSFVAALRDASTSAEQAA
jgi:trehalose 6-phosphate synthase